MESAPRRKTWPTFRRDAGRLSGGYLLAAVGMQTIAPRFGWQIMFVVGAVVAVLIVLITLKAPESDAWKIAAQALREGHGCDYAGTSERRLPICCC